MPGARGRVLRLPVGEGPDRQGDPGKRPQNSVELAALILEEVEVAVVPGEAFGTPGYLRLSYALGDEDLVEGVSRIQKLLAEARD
ncbi:aminotransferase class I/II-fold pyridoxal phosphate-dependent enzyme [Streptomyces sp. INA 01156]